MGAQPVDQLGLIAAGQRETAALGERHLIKGMVLVLDIDVLARRRPIAENADPRRMQPNGGQAIRLRIGQGTQEQRIHHAENCRIGADSDGQRCHNHQRQPRACPEHPKGIAKIL